MCSLLHDRSLWLHYAGWIREKLSLKAHFGHQVRNEGLNEDGDGEKGSERTDESHVEQRRSVKT